MTSKQNKIYALDGNLEYPLSYQEWVEMSKDENPDFSDEEAKADTDEGIKNGVLVEVVWNGFEQKWVKA